MWGSVTGEGGEGHSKHLGQLGQGWMLTEFGSWWDGKGKGAWGDSGIIDSARGSWRSGSGQCKVA